MAKRVTRQKQGGIMGEVLSGEWWINEHGQAIYADGDVGDINHEHVVITHCLQRVLALFEQSEFDFVKQLAYELQQYLEHDGVDVLAVRTRILDYGDELQKAGKITEEQADDFPEYLQQLVEADPQEFAVATNASADGRLYAITRLLWARVRGHDIEAWDLTRELLKRLADGLFDAYVGAEEHSLFNLETRRFSQYYVNIPWRAIESGDTMWIRKNCKNL